MADFPLMILAATLAVVAAQPPRRGAGKGETLAALVLSVFLMTGAFLMITNR